MKKKTKTELFYPAYNIIYFYKILKISYRVTFYKLSIFLLYHVILSYSIIFHQHRSHPSFPHYTAALRAYTSNYALCRRYSHQNESLWPSLRATPLRLAKLLKCACCTHFSPLKLWQPRQGVATSTPGRNIVVRRMQWPRWDNEVM